MKSAFNAAVFAAALAACGGTPQDYRNEKDPPLPAGQGAFGKPFDWEWRKKDAPAPASSAPATEPAAPAAAATTPQDASKERQEFEEWRAWQERKRKNQK